MYKIVPAERQGRSKGTITKNRCKPSKNGLQRSFLAPPARLELTTFRLGGGPSILVRYGGIYRNYSVIQGSGIRTVRLLGGDRSIQLSYGGIYRIYSIIQGSGIRPLRLFGGVCYIHLTKEACRCIVAQVFHTVKRALPRQAPGKGLDFYRSSRK